MLNILPSRCRACLLSLMLIASCLLLAACAGGSTPTATPTLTTLEVRGQTLFEGHCASCHSVETDSVIVGPSLAGIAERAEERSSGMSARAYLTESILEPDAHVVEGFPDNQMPEDYGEVLEDEDIEALVAYLLTLHE